MSSGMERHEEVTARLYVREVTGIEVTLHDTPNLTGVHDYDLIRNGRIEALEVSIWADKAHMEAEALQRELYQHELKFPGLRWHWEVQVLPRARLKQLSARLIQHLQSLENGGIKVLDVEEAPSSADCNPSDIVTSFRRLGVTHVRSSTRHGDVGAIDIIPGASKDVSFNADDALTLIEGHVTSSRTSDILKKLALSKCERRHVFLWADRAGCPTPYWNIGNTFRRVPSREPDFPGAITDLWCVGASGGWLWQTHLGWQPVPAPYLALNGISGEESSLLRDLHAERR